MSAWGRTAPELLLASTSCAGCGRAGRRLCGRCEDTTLEVSTLRFGDAYVACAASYAGASKHLVLSLKLQGDRSAGIALARLMHRAALRVGLGSAVVTWVPARSADVRRRGFDHGEVLATAFAERTGGDATPLLRWATQRPDQAGLPGTARRANLRNALRARPGRGRVLLLDDVVTTGATARAATAALRAAGFSPVDVLVACRA